MISKIRSYLQYVSQKTQSHNHSIRDMQLLLSLIGQRTRRSRLEPALAIETCSFEKKKKISPGNDRQEVTLMAKSCVLDKITDLVLNFTLTAEPQYKDALNRDETKVAPAKSKTEGCAYFQLWYHVSLYP